MLPAGSRFSSCAPFTLLALALGGGCSATPAVTDGGGPAVDASAMDASAVDASAVDAGTTDVPAAMDTAVTPDAPSGSDVATAPDVVLTDPLSWSVHTAGPFHVGYRNFPLTYTPAGTGAPRSTTVHVWYPTTSTDGPAPRYFNIFPDPGAHTDATPAPPVYPTGYPVLVYSHGSRGFGPTSYFLMDLFASHGWVAVAPDHTTNLLSDTASPPFQIYYLRSMDITAALDAVERLPVGDPLAGHLDTRHVMLTGHSFGTHTVWSSAGATFDVAAIRARCIPAGQCTEADLAVFAHGLRDPRIVAASPLAGAIDRDFFGPTGHTSVTIPLLAMSGTLDPVGDDVQFATTAPVPLTWLDITGGCHQFFALGSCDGIPNDLQVPIVGAYSLAFARRYVLGDTSHDVTSLLDGSQAVSDRVSFHRR